MQTQKAVYQNGGYQVVPLVAGYVVRGAEGNTILQFNASQINMAVESVDELAELSGHLNHCSA